MHTPMISVCMASYNGAPFIGQQIASILSQLADHDELIIADDGSTDGTLEVIAGFDDIRIRLQPPGTHLGVVRNFERALRAARGEWIFLSDQDDVWLPGKVAACTEALRNHTLVVTDCAVVDDALTPRHPSFFALRGSGPGFVRNLIRPAFMGTCMAFRRELLDRALPFPTAIPMHDVWLGLLAELTGRTVFLPRPLLLYRRHGKNASATAESSTAPPLCRVASRATLLWLISIRWLVVHMRGPIE